MKEQIILGSIFATIAISIAIAFIPAKMPETNIRNYALAGQRLKWFDIFSLFTSTSFALGGAVIYFTWLGFKVGYSALLLQFFWCLGLYWLAFHATSIRALAGAKTLHGVISSIYGSKPARIAAIATVLGFTFNIGIEVFSIGTILTSITASKTLIITVMVVISFGVAVYTAIKGMAGNVIVNKIQNAISALALIIIIYVICTLDGTNLTPQSPSSEITTESLIGFLTFGGLLSSIFLNLFWQFGDMSAWQSISASSDKAETAKKGIIATLLIVFFFPGLAAIIIGVLLQSKVTAGNEGELFSAIINMLSGNFVLLAIVVSGLVCAMLSTIDGFMISSAQSIAEDITRSENETKKIAIAKVSIIILSIIGPLCVYLIDANFKIGIFNLVYLGYTAQITLVACAWAAIKKINIGYYGAVSIYAGLASGASFIIYGLQANNPYEIICWGPFVGLSVAAVFVGFGWLKNRVV